MLMQNETPIKPKRRDFQYEKTKWILKRRIKVGIVDGFIFLQKMQKITQQGSIYM